MIVQVMGTNGAGKSFLVRTILDEAKRDSVECSELHVEGRRRPLAMELRYKTGGGWFGTGPLQHPLRRVRHIEDGRRGFSTSCCREVNPECTSCSRASW